MKLLSTKSHIKDISWIIRMLCNLKKIDRKMENSIKIICSQMPEKSLSLVSNQTNCFLLCSCRGKLILSHFLLVSKHFSSISPQSQHFDIIKNCIYDFIFVHEWIMMSWMMCALRVSYDDSFYGGNWITIETFHSPLDSLASKSQKINENESVTRKN